MYQEFPFLMYTYQHLYLTSPIQKKAYRLVPKKRDFVYKLKGLNLFLTFDCSYSHPYYRMDHPNIPHSSNL